MIVRGATTEFPERNKAQHFRKGLQGTKQNLLNDAGWRKSRVHLELLVNLPIGTTLGKLNHAANDYLQDGLQALHRCKMRPGNWRLLPAKGPN
jgi:hypothetical protein